VAGRRGVPDPDRRLDGRRVPDRGRYGAAELPTASNPARTERNVQDSDATLWFGETTTSGAQETIGACQRLGKPCMLIYPGAEFEPSHVAIWIADNEIRTLNVAGNREGEVAGTGESVELFLDEVLQQLGHERA
jgi:Circularly permutated YpsA SLOG family